MYRMTKTEMRTEKSFQRIQECSPSLIVNQDLQKLSEAESNQNAQPPSNSICPKTRKQVTWADERTPNYNNDDLTDVGVRESNLDIFSEIKHDATDPEVTSLSMSNADI